MDDVKILIVQHDNTVYCLAIFMNYHLRTRGSNAGCLFVYAKGEPVLMSSFTVVLWLNGLES